jgi:hypothetical protein
MAQADSSFRLAGIIRGDISAFTVDNLDNIYLLDSRNQVKKLNANFDSVGVYNDVRKYGKASLIDVSNPLKVLLYYKDFGTIVMLDRFLNAVNTIDLRKQKILQAKIIGQSYDNKIWVFDEYENKLKKIDENGKLMVETPDLRLLVGEAITPVKLFDESRYVYMYDSVKGVYVFDYYGALKNVVMISHWQNLKVVDKYIFGSKADTLYRYDINSFRYDEWTMPQEIKEASVFNFTADKLYALKMKPGGETEISVYTMK